MNSPICFGPIGALIVGSSSGAKVSNSLVAMTYMPVRIIICVDVRDTVVPETWLKVVGGLDFSIYRIRTLDPLDDPKDPYLKPYAWQYAVIYKGSALDSHTSQIPGEFYDYWNGNEKALEPLTRGVRSYSTKAFVSIPIAYALFDVAGAHPARHLFLAQDSIDEYIIFRVHESHLMAGTVLYYKAFGDDGITGAIYSGLFAPSITQIRWSRNSLQVTGEHWVIGMLSMPVASPFHRDVKPVLSRQARNFVRAHAYSRFFDRFTQLLATLPRAKTSGTSPVASFVIEGGRYDKVSKMFVTSLSRITYFSLTSHAGFRPLVYHTSFLYDMKINWYENLAIAPPSNLRPVYFPPFILPRKELVPFARGFVKYGSDSDYQVANGIDLDRCDIDKLALATSGFTSDMLSKVPYIFINFGIVKDTDIQIVLDYASLYSFGVKAVNISEEQKKTLKFWSKTPQ